MEDTSERQGISNQSEGERDQRLARERIEGALRAQNNAEIWEGVVDFTQAGGHPASLKSLLAPGPHPGDYASYARDSIVALQGSIAAQDHQRVLSHVEAARALGIYHGDSELRQLLETLESKEKKRRRSQPILPLKRVTSLVGAKLFARAAEAFRETDEQFAESASRGMRLVESDFRKVMKIAASVGRKRIDLSSYAILQLRGEQREVEPDMMAVHQYARNFEDALVKHLFQARVVPDYLEKHTGGMTDMFLFRLEILLRQKITEHATRLRSSGQIGRISPQHQEWIRAWGDRIQRIPDELEDNKLSSRYTDAVNRADGLQPDKVSVGVSASETERESLGYAVLTSYYLTDTGSRREINEDHAASWEPRTPRSKYYDAGDPEAQKELRGGNLYLVADGLGGLKQGEVASREGCAQMLETFLKNASSPRERLLEALKETNHKIYETGPEGPGTMATTMVAAAIVGHELYVAHTGDSRAYLLRNGEFRQLTRDHSWLQIVKEDRENLELFRQRHPGLDQPKPNMITKSLGGSPQIDQPNVTTYDLVSGPMPLQKGDRVLICTDGLWGSVPEAIISQRLASSSDPENACNRLIMEALDAGGPDNITVLVVDVNDLVAEAD